MDRRLPDQRSPPATMPPSRRRSTVSLASYPPICYGGQAALVTVDDRGYLIWLYGSDDVGWFRDIVATVKLRPEDATDRCPLPRPE